MKILVYPFSFSKGHKIRNYLDFLGIEYTRDILEIDSCDLLWHWDAGNINSIPKSFIDSGKKIINSKCLNIKKDFVDKCFEKVFGYSLFINPLKHQGFAVRKSTQQAVHDGQIIECPISKSKEKIRPTSNDIKHKFTYQRLIDNRIFNTRNPVHCQGMQMIRDIRVPIINGTIPLVWFKDKNIRNTFEPLPNRAPNRDQLMMKCSVEYDVNKVFTKDEQQKIIGFCKESGVDVADLDILRDNGTGQIYIIDINNIAANTLFSKLTKEDKNKSIEIVSFYLKKYLDKLLQDE